MDDIKEVYHFNSFTNILNQDIIMEIRGELVTLHPGEKIAGGEDLIGKLLYVDYDNETYHFSPSFILEPIGVDVKVPFSHIRETTIGPIKSL